MHSSVTRRRSRAPLAFLTGLGIAAASLAAAAPAGALGYNNPGPDCESVAGQAMCQSDITFAISGASGATTVASGTWSPPPCWYEPSFVTPKELEIAYAIPVIDKLVWLATNGDTGTNGNFHAGEKGRWWMFVYNPSMPDAQAQCQLSGKPLLEWVPDTVAAPAEAVTAWKMAAAARNVVPVLPPTLALNPGAGKQVVNLATLISVDPKTPFSRTWVTASLNVNGYTLAATTVATPASITVDAGTPNASPRSCTYKFAQVATDKNKYQIDPASTQCSDGSSGPNAGIIYRRPTASGATYPLTATTTWNVTWTNTASPDSPPQTDPTLPPLTVTSAPVGVTVNEVEAINPTP